MPTKHALKVFTNVIEIVLLSGSVMFGIFLFLPMRDREIRKKGDYSSRDEDARLTHHLRYDVFKSLCVMVILYA
jgi:hypothetical protein